MLQANERWNAVVTAGMGLGVVVTGAAESEENGNRIGQVVTELQVSNANGSAPARGEVRRTW